MATQPRGPPAAIRLSTLRDPGSGPLASHDSPSFDRQTSTRPEPLPVKTRTDVPSVAISRRGSGPGGSATECQACPSSEKIIPAPVGTMALEPTWLDLPNEPSDSGTSKRSQV